MTQSLPPGAETVSVPVDFQTYQQQLRRVIAAEVGDKMADALMDRAMLAAQVEVLYTKAQEAEHERAELAGQVGVLTQQLRASGTPDETSDGQPPAGDTR